MGSGYSKNSTPERIIKTTFRLLTQYGYANTNMRLIASEAGVAISQLTYHFLTKKKLILAVLDDVIERFVLNLRKEASADITASEKLYRISSFVRNALADRNILKLVVDFSAQAMWDEALRERISQLFTRVADIIEQVLMEDGFTPNENGWESPRAAAEFMTGAFYGTAVQSLLGLGKNSTADAVRYFDKTISANMTSYSKKINNVGDGNGKT